MRINSSTPTHSPVPPPAFTPGQYSAPKQGEALRLGHSGPEVLELQKKLNAAGAKPPLALDGKLGPKTFAAMTKTAPAAQTDGFTPAAASPSQPTSLNGASASETVATAAPSNASAVSQRVVDNAIAQNDSINPMKRGEDGKIKGWKELQSTFEQATGWKPSDEQCQTVTPGGGVKPGGASWCGIWACNMLQKSGCNVKWDMTKGGMVGDVTHTLAPKFTNPSTYKIERQAFEQSIRPGDVITVPGQNHHAIVTKVNSDGTVETMDGNKPHVGPGKQKLSDVQTFYRANE